eukprot:gnl/TRDRNA2_/TRDRNA2_44887_c0_seq1.p1 gnl/TRDRNA2_/TRDRNA2_44887_c0~~gnl/TRDRNA2_/TRDRNA2_44887_c0_seq1.p1  ORF type:complete len:322 (-),score=46.80 gnl/TRDRNA2_/TRDRNA2_44887_c0_seq1:66-986(-)
MAASAGGAQSAIAALVAPDETAYDLLRALHCSRGTGLECVDRHLRGGCLGPGELVVLHGDVGTAKTALLRNIIAAYIGPIAGGGYAVPVVLIDAEGAFDMMLLARLIESSIERTRAEARGAGARGDLLVGLDNGEPAAELVEEALSRLLVLQPREPLDLLRHLSRLREVFKANPTTALLAVDSMSAWQSLMRPFPRTVDTVLRECWNALARLQQEHSIAVIVTSRDLSEGGTKVGQAWPCPSDGRKSAACCHLGIVRAGSSGRCGTESGGREIFAVSSRGGDSHSGPIPAVPFALGHGGEVVAAAH